MVGGDFGVVCWSRMFWIKFAQKWEPGVLSRSWDYILPQHVLLALRIYFKQQSPFCDSGPVVFISIFWEESCWHSYHFEAFQREIFILLWQVLSTCDVWHVTLDLWEHCVVWSKGDNGVCLEDYAVDMKRYFLNCKLSDRCSGIRSTVWNEEIKYVS